MVKPVDSPPRQVAISTLCPECGQICSWYRKADLLYGVCPAHGRIKDVKILSRVGSEKSAPAVSC